MTADSLSERITSAANGIQTTLHLHDTNTTNATPKPHLVFAAVPASGHTMPLIRLASELIQLGYTASVLTSPEFAPAVTQAGAVPFMQPSFLDETLLQLREAIPAGAARIMFDMEHIFIRPLAPRHTILTQALESIRADPDHTSREIVCIMESAFLGHLPLVSGAPLPKGFSARPRVININVIPYILSSTDVPPFGLALPPDSSDFGRARNGLLAQMMSMGPIGGLIQLQAELLEGLGAKEFRKEGVYGPWDAWGGFDAFLQMCPPSVEYGRSDWAEGFRFAGCLPPQRVADSGDAAGLPEWWADVTRGDKKVVMVAQGTVATEYEDLIIPTLKALKGKEELLVVAVLGVKGAQLPADMEIPDNARVVDHLAYDLLLKHAAVFVMNAGYGGFLHGVANGVPMVLAGVTEDKADVAARGEWAGVAVNLKTGRPSLEAVRAGVDKVLADPDFKKRVVEAQRENDALDTVRIVEEAILGK